MGRIFDSMAQLRGVSFEEFKISSRTFILDTLGEKETEKKQRFSIPVRILLTQNEERKARGQFMRHRERKFCARLYFCDPCTRG